MNNDPLKQPAYRRLRDKYEAEIASNSAFSAPACALPTSATRTMPNAAAIDLLREQRDVFAEEYNLPDLTLSQTICLLIKRQA